MNSVKTMFLFCFVWIAVLVVAYYYEELVELNPKKLIQIYSYSYSLLVPVIDTTKVYLSNEWVINGDVLQYSVISTHNFQQDVEIESIVMLYKEPDKNSTRCIVIIDQSRVINKTVDDLFKMEKTRHTIYKASCILPKMDINSSPKLLVAIVDSRDMLSLSDILFQKPVLRPRPVTKKQTLINCIQTLRDIDSTSANQLQNYIQINRAMGVDKLRFCTIDYENELILNLTRTYSDYIDFVPIDLNVERVCTRLGLEVNSCKKKWAGHFDQKNLLGLYEKTCSNECFMRYRYEYQYISNYDVDELIFPRLQDTNYPERVLAGAIKNKSNKTECKEPYQQYLDDFNKTNLNYNMNDYVKHLRDKLGNNVACFMFENYLVINRYDYFFDKIKQSSQNQWPNIVYENKEHHMTFQLQVEMDSDYLNKLVELIELSKCVNQTYLSKSKLVNMWKKGATTHINNRFGKSISNTDYAFSLNPHSCTHIKEGSRKVEVPIEMGYVSHFRGFDIYTHGLLSYPIRKFKLDIEYLFFLIKHSETFTYQF